MADGVPPWLSDVTDTDFVSLFFDENAVAHQFCNLSEVEEFKSGLHYTQLPSPSSNGSSSSSSSPGSAGGSGSGSGGSSSSSGGSSSKSSSSSSGSTPKLLEDPVLLMMTAEGDNGQKNYGAEHAVLKSVASSLSRPSKLLALSDNSAFSQFVEFLHRRSRIVAQWHSSAHRTFQSQFYVEEEGVGDEKESESDGKEDGDSSYDDGEGESDDDLDDDDGFSDASALSNDSSSRRVALQNAYLGRLPTGQETLARINTLALFPLIESVGETAPNLRGNVVTMLTQMLQSLPFLSLRRSPEACLDQYRALTQRLTLQDASTTEVVSKTPATGNGAHQLEALAALFGLAVQQGSLRHILGAIITAMKIDLSSNAPSASQRKPAAKKAPASTKTFRASVRTYTSQLVGHLQLKNIPQLTKYSFLERWQHLSPWLEVKPPLDAMYPASTLTGRSGSDSLSKGSPYDPRYAMPGSGLGGPGSSSSAAQKGLNGMTVTESVASDSRFLFVAGTGGRPHVLKVGTGLRGSVRGFVYKSGASLFSPGRSRGWLVSAYSQAADGSDGRSEQPAVAEARVDSDRDTARLFFFPHDFLKRVPAKDVPAEEKSGDGSVQEASHSASATESSAQDDDASSEKKSADEESHVNAPPDAIVELDRDTLKPCGTANVKGLPDDFAPVPSYLCTSSSGTRICALRADSAEIEHATFSVDVFDFTKDSAFTFARTVTLVESENAAQHLALSYGYAGSSKKKRGSRTWKCFATDDHFYRFAMDTRNESADIFDLKTGKFLWTSSSSPYSSSSRSQLTYGQACCFDARNNCIWDYDAQTFVVQKFQNFAAPIVGKDDLTLAKAKGKSSEKSDDSPRGVRDRKQMRRSKVKSKVRKPSKKVEASGGSGQNEGCSQPLIGAHTLLKLVSRLSARYNTTPSPSLVPPQAQHTCAVDVHPATFQYLVTLLTLAQDALTRQNVSVRKVRILLSMVAETLNLTVRQLAHAVSTEFTPSEHRGCEAHLARLKELLLGLTKFELPVSYKEFKGLPDVLPTIQQPAAEALYTGLAYFYPTAEERAALVTGLKPLSDSDEARFFSALIVAHARRLRGGDPFIAGEEALTVLLGKSSIRKFLKADQFLGALLRKCHSTTTSLLEAARAQRDGTSASTNPPHLMPQLELLVTLQRIILANIDDTTVVIEYIRVLFELCTEILKCARDAIEKHGVEPKTAGSILKSSLVGVLLPTAVSTLFLYESSSDLDTLATLVAPASSKECGSVPLLVDLLSSLAHYIDLADTEKFDNELMTRSVSPGVTVVERFETKHPYQHGSQTQNVSVKGAISLALTFDPRSCTVNRQDTLSVTGAQGKLILTASGPNHNWPHQPIVVSGSTVRFNWRAETNPDKSADSNSVTRYGVRCTVRGFRPHEPLNVPWLLDIQHSVALVASDLARFYVFSLADDDQYVEEDTSAVNIEEAKEEDGSDVNVSSGDEEEPAYASEYEVGRITKWLKTELFANGLRSENPDVPAEKFLADIIGDLPSVKPLLDFMGRAVPGKPMLPHAAQSLWRAERSVIACLLHHANLVEDAMALAQKPSNDVAEYFKLEPIWQRVHVITRQLLNLAREERDWADSVQRKVPLSEWAPSKLHLSQSNALDLLCDFKGVHYDASDVNATLSNLYEKMEKDMENSSKAKSESARSSAKSSSAPIASSTSPSSPRGVRSSAISAYEKVADHVITRAAFLLRVSGPATPNSRLKSSQSSTRLLISRSSSFLGRRLDAPTLLATAAAGDSSFEGGDLTLTRSVSKVSELSDIESAELNASDLAAAASRDLPAPMDPRWDTSLNRALKRWKSHYRVGSSSTSAADTSEAGRKGDDEKSGRLALACSVLVSAASPGSIEAAIDAHNRDAERRCKGFDALNALLKSVPVSATTNSLLMSFADEARATWTDPDVESGPYYMFNVEGCSPELADRLRTCYMVFLGHLVDIMSDSSNKANNRRLAHDSTILLCIDTLGMMYREADVGILSQSKVFQTLRELMASQTRSNDVVKAARTCFRQLSTICVLWPCDADDATLRNFQVSIFDSLFQELRREVSPTPTPEKSALAPAEPEASSSTESSDDKAKVSGSDEASEKAASSPSDKEDESAPSATSDAASYELLVLIFHLRRSAAAKDHLARPTTISTLLSLLDEGTLRLQRLAVQLLKYIFTTRGIYSPENGAGVHRTEVDMYGAGDAQDDHSRSSVIERLMMHIGALLVAEEKRVAAAPVQRPSSNELPAEGKPLAPGSRKSSSHAKAPKSTSDDRYSLVLHNPDSKNSVTQFMGEFTGVCRQIFDLLTSRDPKQAEKLNSVLRRQLLATNSATLMNGSRDDCVRFAQRMSERGFVVSVVPQTPEAGLLKNRNIANSDASSRWNSGYARLSLASELVNLIRVLGLSYEWEPHINEYITTSLRALPNLSESLQESESEIEVQEMLVREPMACLAVLGGFTEILRDGGKVLVLSESRQSGASLGIESTSVAAGTASSASSSGRSSANEGTIVSFERGREEATVLFDQDVPRVATKVAVSRLRPVAATSLSNFDAPFVFKPEIIESIVEFIQTSFEEEEKGEKEEKSSEPGAEEAKGAESESTSTDKDAKKEDASKEADKSESKGDAIAEGAAASDSSEEEDAEDDEGVMNAKYLQSELYMRCLQSLSTLLEAKGRCDFITNRPVGGLLELFVRLAEKCDPSSKIRDLETQSVRMHERILDLRNPASLSNGDTPAPIKLDQESGSLAHPTLPHFRYAAQAIGQKLPLRFSTRGANCIMFEDADKRIAHFCRPNVGNQSGPSGGDGRPSRGGHSIFGQPEPFGSSYRGGRGGRGGYSGTGRLQMSSGGAIHVPPSASSSGLASLPRESSSGNVFSSSSAPRRGLRGGPSRGAGSSNAPQSGASASSSGDATNSEFLLVANNPVLETLPEFYFEIEIKDLPSGGSLSIGFAPKRPHVDRDLRELGGGLLGQYGQNIGNKQVVILVQRPWTAGSIRINNKKGEIIRVGADGESTTPYGESFAKGDVIGCGWNLRDKAGSMYFTKNGVSLGECEGQNSVSFVPAVGFTKARTKVKVNFGQEPFRFELEEHEEREETEKEKKERLDRARVIALQKELEEKEEKERQEVAKVAAEAAKKEAAEMVLMICGDAVQHDIRRATKALELCNENPDQTVTWLMDDKVNALRQIEALIRDEDEAKAAADKIKEDAKKAKEAEEKKQKEGEEKAKAAPASASGADSNSKSNDDSADKQKDSAEKKDGDGKKGGSGGDKSNESDPKKQPEKRASSVFTTSDNGGSPYDWKYSADMVHSLACQRPLMDDDADAGVDSRAAQQEAEWLSEVELLLRQKQVDPGQIRSVMTGLRAGGDSRATSMLMISDFVGNVPPPPQTSAEAQMDTSKVKNVKSEDLRVGLRVLISKSAKPDPSRSGASYRSASSSLQPSQKLKKLAAAKMPDKFGKLGGNRSISLPTEASQQSVWVSAMDSCVNRIGTVQRIDVTAQPELVLVRFDRSETSTSEQWWFPTSALLQVEKEFRDAFIGFDEVPEVLSANSRKTIKDMSSLYARKCILNITANSPAFMKKVESGEVAVKFSHLLRLAGAEVIPVLQAVKRSPFSNVLRNIYESTLVNRPNMCADIFEQCSEMVRTSTSVIRSSDFDLSDAQHNEDGTSGLSARKVAVRGASALVISFGKNSHFQQAGASAVIYGDASCTNVLKRYSSHARSGPSAKHKNHPSLLPFVVNSNEMWFTAEFNGNISDAQNPQVPPLHVEICPLSGEFGLAMWMIDSLVEKLSESPVDNKPKNICDILTRSLMALAKFLSCPNIACVVRSVAFQALSRGLRVLPEAPREGFKPFYAAEFFCEMQHLHRSSEPKADVFSTYFQNLVELLVTYRHVFGEASYQLYAREGMKHFGGASSSSGDGKGSDRKGSLFKKSDKSARGKSSSRGSGRGRGPSSSSSSSSSRGGGRGGRGGRAFPRRARGGGGSAANDSSRHSLAAFASPGRRPAADRWGGGSGSSGGSGLQPFALPPGNFSMPSDRDSALDALLGPGHDAFSAAMNRASASGASESAMENILSQISFGDSGGANSFSASRFFSSQGVPHLDFDDDDDEDDDDDDDFDDETMEQKIQQLESLGFDRQASEVALSCLPSVEMAAEALSSGEWSDLSRVFRQGALDDDDDDDLSSSPPGSVALVRQSSAMPLRRGGRHNDGGAYRPIGQLVQTVSLPVPLPSDSPASSPGLRPVNLFGSSPSRGGGQSRARSSSANDNSAASGASSSSAANNERSRSPISSRSSASQSASSSSATTSSSSSSAAAAKPSQKGNPTKRKKPTEAGSGKAGGAGRDGGKAAKLLDKALDQAVKVPWFDDLCLLGVVLDNFQSVTARGRARLSEVFVRRAFAELKGVDAEAAKVNIRLARNEHHSIWTLAADAELRRFVDVLSETKNAKFDTSLGDGRPAFPADDDDTTESRAKPSTRTPTSESKEAKEEKSEEKSPSASSPQESKNVRRSSKSTPITTIAQTPTPGSASSVSSPHTSVPSPQELLFKGFPHLLAIDNIHAIRRRIYVLKKLNELVGSSLPFIDLSQANTNPWSIAAQVASCRGLITRATKKSFIEATLLATTVETPTSSGVPKISIDRIVAAAARDKQIRSADYTGGTQNSIFGQAFRQLWTIHPSRLKPPRQPGSRPHISFEVKFKGEHAQGEGGLYRAFFTDVGREIHEVTGDDGEAVYTLPLFIQTPNRQSLLGENRDKHVPRPSSTGNMHLTLYEFLGRLMGIAARTGILMKCDFPSFVWKPLVGLGLNLADLEGIDKSFSHGVLQRLRDYSDSDENKFKADFGDSLTNSVHLSDKSFVALRNGGESLPVPFADRREYADTALRVRLNESQRQLMAVKQGLASVIPEELLCLCTGDDLERLICGKPEIDIELLKRHTEYGGVDENAPHIKYFWQVLEEFSQEDRRKFIKFAWAQERLPATDEDFKRPGQKIRLLIKNRAVSDGQNPDDAFPRADTCFFNFELPQYSSLEVMHSKLSTVINLGAGMDGDADVELGDDEFGVIDDDESDPYSDSD